MTIMTIREAMSDLDIFYMKVCLLIQLRKKLDRGEASDVEHRLIGLLGRDKEIAELLEDAKKVVDSQKNEG